MECDAMVRMISARDPFSTAISEWNEIQEYYEETRLYHDFSPKNSLKSVKEGNEWRKTTISQSIPSRAPSQETLQAGSGNLIPYSSSSAAGADPGHSATTPSASSNRSGRLFLRASREGSVDLAGMRKKGSGKKERKGSKKKAKTGEVSEKEKEKEKEKKAKEKRKRSNRKSDETSPVPISRSRSMSCGTSSEFSTLEIRGAMKRKRTRTRERIEDSDDEEEEGKVCYLSDDSSIHSLPTRNTGQPLSPRERRKGIVSEYSGAGRSLTMRSREEEAGSAERTMQQKREAFYAARRAERIPPLPQKRSKVDWEHLIETNKEVLSGSLDNIALRRAQRQERGYLALPILHSSLQVPPEVGLPMSRQGSRFQIQKEGGRHLKNEGPLVEGVWTRVVTSRGEVWKGHLHPSSAYDTFDKWLVPEEMYVLSALYGGPYWRREEWEREEESNLEDQPSTESILNTARPTHVVSTLSAASKEISMKPRTFSTDGDTLSQSVTDLISSTSENISGHEGLDSVLDNTDDVSSMTAPETGTLADEDRCDTFDSTMTQPTLEEGDEDQTSDDGVEEEEEEEVEEEEEEEELDIVKKSRIGAEHSRLTLKEVPVLKVEYTNPFASGKRGEGVRKLGGRRGGGAADILASNQNTYYKKGSGVQKSLHHSGNKYKFSADIMPLSCHKHRSGIFDLNAKAELPARGRTSFPVWKETKSNNEVNQIEDVLEGRGMKNGKNIDGVRGKRRESVLDNPVNKVNLERRQTMIVIDLPDSEEERERKAQAKLKAITKEAERQATGVDPSSSLLPSVTLSPSSLLSSTPLASFSHSVSQPTSESGSQLISNTETPALPQESHNLSMTVENLTPSPSSPTRLGSSQAHPSLATLAAPSTSLAEGRAILEGRRGAQSLLPPLARSRTLYNVCVFDSATAEQFAAQANRTSHIARQRSQSPVSMTFSDNFLSEPEAIPTLRKKRHGSSKGNSVQVEVDDSVDRSLNTLRSQDTEKLEAGKSCGVQEREEKGTAKNSVRESLRDKGGEEREEDVDGEEDEEEGVMYSLQTFTDPDAATPFDDGSDRTGTLHNSNDYKIFKSSMYLKKERTHGAFCDERLGGGHKHIVSNVEEVGEGIKLDDEGEGVNYSLAMDAIDTARPIFSGSEGLDNRGEEDASQDDSAVNYTLAPSASTSQSTFEDDVAVHYNLAPPARFESGFHEEDSTSSSLNYKLAVSSRSKVNGNAVADEGENYTMGHAAADGVHYNIAIPSPAKEAICTAKGDSAPFGGTAVPTQHAVESRGATFAGQRSALEMDQGGASSSQVSPVHEHTHLTWNHRYQDICTRRERCLEDANSTKVYRPVWIPAVSRRGDSRQSSPSRAPLSPPQLAVSPPWRAMSPSHRPLSPPGLSAPPPGLSAPPPGLSMSPTRQRTLSPLRPQSCLESRASTGLERTPPLSPASSSMRTPPLSPLAPSISPTQFALPTHSFSSTSSPLTSEAAALFQPAFMSSHSSNPTIIRQTAIHSQSRQIAISAHDLGSGGEKKGGVKNVVGLNRSTQHQNLPSHSPLSAQMGLQQTAPSRLKNDEVDSTKASFSTSSSHAFENRSKEVLETPTNIEKRLQGLNTELMALAQDFIYTAKVYGRIIILERYLNYEAKTIKPVRMGGQAGGEKYIINGVLFKFAVDSMGLYGGSDSAAAKVAGHDLSGLTAYRSCGNSKLCTPFMALVDFMGFRVIAMSVLPIDQSTLVYGSDDGGMSVRNLDPEVNEVMKDAGRLLNLRPHYVGSWSQRKWLSSAGDIEGHRGKDGRLYFVDFSRTFPPTTPEPAIQGSHLFMLFRPEFIKTYPRPLCPDAFTGFIRSDKKRNEYNQHVMEATVYLKTIVIPSFVCTLKQLFVEKKMAVADFHAHIEEEFHKVGINMRYLGVCLSYSSGVEALEKVFLIEAVARVNKNILKLRLRQKMKDIRDTVMLAPYRELVVDFMNLIFREDDWPACDTFWSTSVVECLQTFFNVEVCPKNLRQDMVGFQANYVGAKELPRLTLFKRLVQLTNLDFVSTIERRLRRRQPLGRAPFDITNFIRFGTTVKHTADVTNAEGSFFFMKAFEFLKCLQLAESYEMLQVARQKYEQLLIRSPHNKDALLQLARTHRRSLETKAVLHLCSPGGTGSMLQTHMSPKEIEDAMASTILDTANEDVMQASRYLQRTVEADPDDERIRLLQACFSVQCEEYSQGASQLLDGLQQNPEHTDFLIAYGLMLVLCGNHSEQTQEGLRFLRRADLALTCVSLLKKWKERENFV